MIEVYFIRHSKIDYIPSEMMRSLSSEGRNELSKLVKVFQDINIDKIYCSPYRRAIETVEPIANLKKQQVIIVDELRERDSGQEHIDDFEDFSKRQWANHDYKLENGESLNEVKLRAVNFLSKIIKSSNGSKYAVGTHGTFLSCLINHFECEFGYNEWKSMTMPSVYKFTFNDDSLTKIEEVGL